MTADYVCTCGHTMRAKSLHPRHPECPKCGERMVLDWDEENDHHERRRDDDD